MLPSIGTDRHGTGCWNLTTITTRKPYLIDALKQFSIFIIIISVIFISCEKKPVISNTAPLAVFTVNPASGNTNTSFTFDPTTSHDKEDSATSLKARWDWEGDGTWDTDYGSLSVTYYSFSEEGTYNVNLEVKDPAGLVNQTAREVIVSDSSNSQYVVVFWTKSDKGIDVSINSNLIGTITKSYSSSPDCYVEGCVTYESSVADISYSAVTTDGSQEWPETNITLTEGCNAILLVITGDSEETTETIGSDGGKIIHNDMELTIPSGAFSGDQIITITGGESTDNFFPTLQDAEIYKIEGMPNDFSSPIEVKFNISQLPSADDFAITLAETGFIKSMNDDRISSITLETERYDDIIIANILPGDLGPVLKSAANPKEGQSQGTFWLSYLSSVGRYTSGLFRITYDTKEVTNQTLIKDLHKYLVTAYDIVKNDFNLSWAGRTSWPLKVEVKKMGESYDGSMVMPNFSWSVNSYYLTFNTMILPWAGQVKTTAMHELFHIAQELYNSTGSKVHYWFDEATAVWSEDFAEMGSTGNFVDDNVRKLQPFYGMQNISSSGYREHGYGMAYFAKYLTDKLGKTVIRDIYDEINNGTHVVQSIFNQFGNTNPGWFSDFIKTYLEGGLYGELALEFEILDLPVICAFASDTDTLKVFQESVHDLGCDLFNMPLSYDYTEHSYLEFDLTGLSGLGELMIFKYKIGGGQYMQLIAEDVYEYTLENVKELKDQGYKLMIAVPSSRAISPFTGSVDYTFKVKRKERYLDLSIFDHVGYGFYYTEYHYTGIEDSVEVSGIDDFSPMCLPQGWDGSFSGNQFNETAATWGGFRSIRLYIDTVNMVVDSLFANCEYDLPSPYIGSGNYKIIIRDVPLVKNDRWGISFQVTGQAIDGHIGEIEMYYQTSPMHIQHRLHYLIFSGESQLYIFLTKIQ